jgi:MFS family permease
MSSARRNYLLSVWNGIAFNVGETFIDPATVLALLVSQLTTRGWVVGLAVALTEIGWYLPQILTIQFLERRSRRLPIYRAMAVVRILGLLGALAAIVLLGDRDPATTLFWFLLAFAVFAFAGGFSAVAFYDVVGRTVPLSWHPRLWGQRLFYGGLLSALCALLVRELLERPDFVGRFGTLFALGTVFIALGAIFFTFAEEPPVEVSRKEMHLAAHLRESVGAAWRDRAFRALFGTRVALAGAAMATPFLVLFAVRTLSLPAAVVGGFLTAKIVGYVGANPLWQRVATRHGNRAVMVGVALLAMGAPACALAARLLPADGPWQGGVLALAFALVGATVSGTNIGYQSLLLAIAPAARRPSSVGLMNSFVGPAAMLPALGGLLVDATQPELIFGVAILCAVLGLVLARRLPSDPAEDARPGPDRERAG